MSRRGGVTKQLPPRTNTRRDILRAFGQCLTNLVHAKKRRMRQVQEGDRGATTYGKGRTLHDHENSRNDYPKKVYNKHESVSY